MSPASLPLLCITKVAYGELKFPSAVSSLSEAKDLGGQNKEKVMYYVYILTNKSNKVMYIGITNDVERRLFNEHNVSKKGAWWIYREADSKDIAQAVEEYFLEKGMQGDTGGGNEDSVYVYCYEITNNTVE